MITAITLLSTACDADSQARCAAVLEPRERARAARFRQSDDARRYIVTRAALRMLLAQRLQQSPAVFTFGTIGRGKPVLDAVTNLHFNVSHAGDWAVIAVGAAPVGIDIERRRAVDYGAVGETVFSAAEQTRLRAAADPHRTFFDLWTAKEALLKAWALGLGDMPGDFTTPAWAPVHPDAAEGAVRNPAAALAHDEDAVPHVLARFAALAGLEPAAPFSMGPLPVPAGYCGALCVREPASLTPNAPSSTYTFTRRTPLALLRAMDDLQSVC